MFEKQAQFDWNYIGDAIVQISIEQTFLNVSTMRKKHTKGGVKKFAPKYNVSSPSKDISN
jgi:hypothetical protein